MIALVTGANKGLGRETARQLAGLGMTVLVGSRDQDRGASVAAALGSGARPVRLDVTDSASLRAAADEVAWAYGRLDVLVNNAGISVMAPAGETDGATLRQVLDVNVIGVADTIRAFLPLLQRSAAPRIVNVSSTTASLTLTAAGTDFGGDAATRLAYSTSKAALNMLTVQYANAFRRDPGLSRIRINAATPGYVATDMNGHRGTRTVEEGARIIVQLATLPADGPTGGFFNDQGTVPW
ncbi:MAG: SDR family oxidoreductase [Nocardiopsaceae bacterium]|nr:SDR family oxidoreductase [Nocardiopsaceae bacterium]